LAVASYHSAWRCSRNAALRLLAWTVADASGASVALDTPLALTVGKRLDRDMHVSVRQST
jgi:hypothetical protein